MYIVHPGRAIGRVPYKARWGPNAGTPLPNNPSTTYFANETNACATPTDKQDGTRGYQNRSGHLTFDFYTFGITTS